MGLCTNLSVACAGYAVGKSGPYAGYCAAYGSMLPDTGMGAAAKGEALYGWSFTDSSGSDTLTRANGYAGVECHAKQPGASGMHPPMPSPPAPSTL